MAYDPAKDPRNDPRYQRLIKQAGGVNRNLADAIEKDARNGHVKWSEMQDRVSKAEKIRSVANELAGSDPDSPRNKKRLQELEKLAGGKGKAKKAVEDATLAAGAKNGVLRRFMRGW